MSSAKRAIIRKEALVRRRKEYFTNNGNIDESFSPGVEWMLYEIRIHLSDVGGDNDLVISIDSGSGNTYDLVLLTQDMTAIEDLRWTPNTPIHLEPNDEIVLAWTQTLGRTYGIEVVYSKVGI